MLNRIRDEARRLEYQCLWAAERHYAAETPLYALNHWLGIPSAVLAAIAGTTAFTTFQHHEWVTAVIALSASVLTSLLTFIDPYKKASVHHRIGRGFEALYHDAGILARFEVERDNPNLPGLDAKLEALVTKFNELLQSSPGLPGHAYRTAAKNLATSKGEVLRVPDDYIGKPS